MTSRRRWCDAGSAFYRSASKLADNAFQTRIDDGSCAGGGSVPVFLIEVPTA